MINVCVNQILYFFLKRADGPKVSKLQSIIIIIRHLNYQIVERRNESEVTDCVVVT